MFRKIRGIRLPYKTQGLIWFLLKGYDGMPGEMKGYVDALCREIGKEDARALFDYLTTDDTACCIAGRYYVRENNLYDMRRKFYSRFYAERLLNRQGDMGK